MSRQDEERCPWCDDSNVGTSENVECSPPYLNVFAKVCYSCHARGPECATEAGARLAWSKHLEPMCGCWLYYDKDHAERIAREIMSWAHTVATVELGGKMIMDYARGKK